jgi:hypothetical protein
MKLVYWHTCMIRGSVRSESDYVTESSWLILHLGPVFHDPTYLGLNEALSDFEILKSGIL